jgi:hypothetical protein
MNSESPSAVWRKSTYSTSTGNCVEVARTPASMHVRDSKNPAAGTVPLPHPAWRAFVRDMERSY